MRALFFLLLMILLASLSQISTAIFLPAIPAIVSSLPAAHAVIHHSVTLFVLGLAVSQLFFGPLSDCVGRRYPLLLGTGIALIGSTLCSFANAPWMLCVGRCLQGIGIGAATTLYRPILSDCFVGNQLAQVSALVVIFRVFLIGALPFLCHEWVTAIGWRNSFYGLLMICALSIALMLIALQETHPHRCRYARKDIMPTLKSVLTHPSFLLPTTCVMTTFTAIIFWIDINIKTHGIDTVANAGWLIPCGIAGIMAGTINALCVTRYGLKRMLQLGMWTMLVAGVWLLLSPLTTQWLPIHGSSVLGLYVFGATLVFINGYAGAFARFRHAAGVAGGIFATGQLTCGLLIHSSATSIPLHFGNIVSSLVLVATAIIGSVLALRLHIPETSNDTDHNPEPALPQ